MILVSYRKQSLYQAILARKVPTEEEKARHYHETALRNANRQITMMQALIDTNKQSFLTTSKDSANLTDLNTEEEAILGDTVDSETI